jgi:hypothetical protein
MTHVARSLLQEKGDQDLVPAFANSGRERSRAILAPLGRAHHPPKAAPARPTDRDRMFKPVLDVKKTLLGS